MIPFITVKRGWNMLLRRCAIQVTVKRGWIMLIGRCTMQVTVKLTRIMFKSDVPCKKR